MAPNGHTRTQLDAVNGESQVDSSKPWYEDHGREEYRIWQKAHPLNHISYEKWKVSKYVGGLSLYYATLRAFDETDSDEEMDNKGSKKRPHSFRDHTTREPRKTSTANRTSASYDRETTATPTTLNVAKSSASSRKKRKPRKQPKSEEVVASQSDSEDSEVPASGAVTPSVTPAIEVNGRRKSSQRKPRKKPLSEETIAPEDEEDEELRGAVAIASPAIASPLPVRSVATASTPLEGSKPLKKTILKLSTRKPVKKKVLSEETVHDEESHDESATNATIAAPQITYATSKPTTSATHTAAVQETNAESHQNGTEVSADPDSAAGTRRGTRVRRPAQQAPYAHDALNYDITSSDPPDTSEIAFQMLKEPFRVDQASSSTFKQDMNHPSVLDAETQAILLGVTVPKEYDAHRRPGKARHYRGKGRAWRKDESDEDLEFEPDKKKTTKSKPKAKAPSGRKRGRPRKSANTLSEDIIRDDSESDLALQSDDTSTLDSSFATASTDPVRRSGRPLRKSALSEEIIMNDAVETDVEMEQDTIKVESDKPDKSTPAPNEQEPPLQSAQNSQPMTPSSTRESAGAYTPKETPPNQPTPLKEEPKRHMLTLKVHVPPEHFKDSEPHKGRSDNAAAVEDNAAIDVVTANNENSDEELCKLERHVG